MKGGRWGSSIFEAVPPTNNPRIKLDGGVDEDLLLFKEIHKREKERMIKINLLHPPDFSEDFDYSSNSGNYPIYRIPSAKKVMGIELPMERGKNDFDWLKTPPATPLFPSLEMEANAPELAIQREIPISRFSGNNLEASSKLNSGSSSSRSKSPMKPPKEKVPSRSVTPISSRPQPIKILTYSTHDHETTHDDDDDQDHNNNNNNNKRLNSVAAVTTNATIEPSNKSTEEEGKLEDSSSSSNSKKSQYCRGGGISDNEAPPNLRTTNRSSSASRGRPNNNSINIINPTTTKSSSISVHQDHLVVQQQQQQSSGFSNLRTTTTSSSSNRSSSASRGRSNYNSINNSIITKPSSIDHLVVQQPQSSGCSNLMTTTSNRSSSASRTGRLNNNSINNINPTTAKSSLIDHHKGVQQQSSVKPMRQSCSPSMSRGRKSIIDTNKQQEQDHDNDHGLTTIRTSKGSIQQAAAAAGNNINGSSSVNVFGSKMVEKVMNARKSSSSSSSVAAGNQDRKTNYKPKVGGSISSSSSSSSSVGNEMSGFGRPKNSFDVALQHKETRRNSINFHQANPPTKNPTTTACNQSSTRRALEQIRCMKVEVKQTVAEEKKEILRRKFINGKLGEK